MMIENLKLLRNIANNECTCTPKQQTGEDVSFCASCKAAKVLNTIGELAEEGLDEILNYANNHQTEKQKIAMLKWAKEELKRLRRGQT